MAEEQSIKDQIAAMEGWAIKAKQNTDSGEYKQAEELLRTINLQGRRLEWRGGKYGLKHLPEMEEVKALKKEISSARASVLEIISMLDKIESFKKKYSVPKEFERRAKSNLDRCKKYTASMIEMLVQAKAVVDYEPWVNPKVLSRATIKPEKKKLLIMLLTGSGYYRHLSEKERKNIIKDIRADGIKLDGANLAGADLYLIWFENASFKKANLRGAKLTAPVFKKADLSGADLRELKVIDIAGGDFAEAKLDHADFSGANVFWSNFYKASLRDAIFVKAFVGGANFIEADLVGADFTEADFGGRVDLKNADVKGVNLKNVKGLTKSELILAKNWSETENRPPQLS